MDRQWWVGKRPWFSGYLEDVKARFKGEIFTTSHGIAGVRTLERRDMENYGNSGASAVSLAVYFGAARVIMIGYDCRKTPKAHWHGDHVKGLGNAGTVNSWPQRFAKLAEKLRDKVEIINCTPGSALKCFKTAELYECLT